MAREHLAMIAAARGDDGLVRELTGEMLRWAMPRREKAWPRWPSTASASLAALGRGDFEEAYRETGGPDPGPAGILAPPRPATLSGTVMDLVEAAVRTGPPAGGRRSRRGDAWRRASPGFLPGLPCWSPRAHRAGGPARPGPTSLFGQALCYPEAATGGRSSSLGCNSPFGEHVRRVRAPQ